MFPGFADWTTRPPRTVGGRIRRLALYVWQHSFRFIAVIIVCVVIFTAKRQVPTPASKSAQTPQAAEAVVLDTPRTTDWPRQYAWLSKRAQATYEPLVNRIAPPEGYARTIVP